MKTSHIFSKKAFVDRAKEKAKEKDYHLIDAGKELAKEVVFAYVLYYGLWLAAILAFLGILSFTEILGGPFVVAQIIFFLVAGSFVLAVVSLWQLWRVIKQELRKLNPLAGKSDNADDVHEAQVVDGRLADE